MNRYSGKHGELKANIRKGHKYFVMTFLFYRKRKGKN